ncbi:Membrane protein YdfJ [Mycobacteroides salmoniphilum]|uniref:Membrane protein YdfJ n=1 Tax=Mycobacteroides salmoniphilum TaxID=404941 RepID=A0A4R8RYL6_9MYCO|nr:MMPL family transporter [Mycobacteroides salmoniphilum]TDZ76411.1 Membrane protein YdfJ [Mycobacteroides salmoniphilum]TDZ78399.1 Membrane protein YdfJ [Mycobacteroides salmoniphilum]TDZ84929.1 Membrane protein YdfJ [Mycobacteroides salmoniphilum]
MFAWWGRMVYRYRFIVVAAFVTICLGSGLFGITLGDHVTQSGFFADNSESVKASVMADDALGRDRTTHVVAVIAAPEGKTVDDPDFQKKVTDHFNQLTKDNPNEVYGWAGWLRAPTSTDPTVKRMVTDDRKHTFVSVSLNGDNDDTILNNYKALSNPGKDDDPAKNKFLLDGVDIQLAGLQPVASELTGTIGKDQQRMEVLSLPVMAVVLFFVFGGVIAAGLPLMVGGLTIAGALGIMRLITLFAPVHFFAQPVVTLIGLGIAIDYSLFIVSRFREEIAEGYDTETAVRRTVITSGRTVMFSATLIAAALMPMLIVPQQFLRSLTYAGIASVLLAAILAVTVLPACLGVLGRHVDALSIKRFSRTKSREELENGFWGRTVVFVMQRPLMFAVPIVIVMLLLIVPLGNLKLGGFSEKYLPPTNSVRVAQEDFDKLFPGFRTETITIVTKGATDSQLNQIRADAMKVPGFVEPGGDKSQMWQRRQAVGPDSDASVKVIQNALINRDTAGAKVKELRAMSVPKGVTMYVGGTPALEQDSIDTVFDKLPLVIVILISVTTILMFLAFGSLVLPIKAAVMSALGLGSTMGILTWIFVDGHFSKWLNFTPTPLTAPVIVLIIVVIYGLSSDYEVFLMSRMIEARHQGLSTTEAVRVGTANTGRIITAAALILIVVAGGFAFSDLVMMKYLAFGLIAALILDATVVRMLLIPAVMKLLGDDCWWAPAWMKRVQVKLGLGEVTLTDERKRPTGREQAIAAATSPVGSNARTTKLQIASERTRLPSTPPARQHDPSAPARPTPTPPAPPTTPVSLAGNTGGDAPATTRMSVPGKNVAPTDAPTTRVPGGNPAGPDAPTTRSSIAGTHRPDRRNADREIESWLGELRGPKQPGSGPAAESGDATTAIPVAKPPQPNRANSTPAEDATTAMPIATPDATRQGPPRAPRPPQSPQPAPPAADATEALPTSGQSRDQKSTPQQQQEADEATRRSRGGSVSAQDLLRREGRRI